jgi:hypothetical protein
MGTVELTGWPAGATVKVVARTYGNDHPGAWEIAPDSRVPSALVHRAPRDDEVVTTATADANGTARVTLGRWLDRVDGVQLGLREGGSAFRRGRYWALGQVDGKWRRVAFTSR